MPVGSPHPFSVGCNESKGWFGSAAAKPLLLHSTGAAVRGGKGVKQSWRTWEERPGGVGSPLAGTGVASAFGVHSQTMKRGGLVLCLMLLFFSFFLLLSLMITGVLCMP